MSLKEDVKNARERWQHAAKETREARDNIDRINKDLKEVDRDLKETKPGSDRRAKLKRREERLEDRKKQEQREQKNFAEMKERRDKVKDELVAKLKKRQREDKPSGGGAAPSGNWTAAGYNTWGGCRSVIDNEVLPVFNKYGVPITSRKRTATYGNPTSDHHVSQTMADAVDGGVGNAYSTQDRVGEAVGVGTMSDYANEYFTYNGVRFRIQTIAGTHERVRTCMLGSAVPDAYRVSDKLVDFVASKEGFVPVAKWDVSQYSYGYGSKAPRAGASISKADAKKLLRKGLEATLEHIPKKDRMKQQEIDALASLTYNLGPRVVVDTSYSTLARRLRSQEGASFDKRREIYADEFGKWVMPGSIYEAGLRKRRLEEKKIARNGDYP